MGVIIKTRPKTTFSHEYDECDVFTVGDKYHTRVYASEPVVGIFNKTFIESSIEDIDTAIGVYKIYEQCPINEIARKDNPKGKKTFMFEYDNDSTNMKHVEAWEYLSIIKDSILKAEKNHVRPFGSLAKDNLER